MRLPKDAVAVELAAHGLFCTSITFVGSVGGYSQRVLAKLIAEAYGGGCGKASTATYWLGYPRAVLAIVYGGMVEPTEVY